MRRGYREFLDPDGVRHGGLPTYPWRMAPAGLATRRQLAELGLRPGGQSYAAQVMWRSRRRTKRGVSSVRVAYLFSVEAAAAKRVPTGPQLVALAAAMRARRTCRSCGEQREYVIPTSLGECLDCAERAEQRLAELRAGVAA
jgi:hypothetical protein